MNRMDALLAGAICFEEEKDLVANPGSVFTF